MAETMTHASLSLVKEDIPGGYQELR